MTYPYSIKNGVSYEAQNFPKNMEKKKNCAPNVNQTSQRKYVKLDNR